MARINLRVGQYVPRPDGDTAERVSRMEAYLVQLSQEIEVLQTLTQAKLHTLEEKLSELEAALSHLST